MELFINEMEQLSAILNSRSSSGSIKQTTRQAVCVCNVTYSRVCATIDAVEKQ